MIRDLAALGTLVGDASRAAMLSTLMDGTAYTAGELAQRAAIKPAAASFHLAKLAAAGFIRVAASGRHRYYVLASGEVAELLETLHAFAPAQRVRSLRHGTMLAAMRQARTCYRHLAGQLGVAVHDALLRQSILADNGGNYRWTLKFEPLAHAFDVALPANAESDRAIVRPCLDCSERRYHLAGAFAVALTTQALERGWLRRVETTRVLTATMRGAAELVRICGEDAALAATLRTLTAAGSPPAPAGGRAAAPHAFRGRGQPCS